MKDRSGFLSEVFFGGGGVRNNRSLFLNNGPLFLLFFVCFY